VQPSESDAVRAVRRLWVSFEARAWEAARAVLADTFVCEWPQTGERFRGRDNYLAMNRAHPARDRGDVAVSIEELAMLDREDGVPAALRLEHEDERRVLVGEKARDGIGDDRDAERHQISSGARCTTHVPVR